MQSAIRFRKIFTSLALATSMAPAVAAPQQAQTPSSAAPVIVTSQSLRDAAPPRGMPKAGYITAYLVDAERMHKLGSSRANSFILQKTTLDEPIILACKTDAKAKCMNPPAPLLATLRESLPTGFQLVRLDIDADNDKAVLHLVTMD